MKSKNKWYITTDSHLGHAQMHIYCGRPVGFETLILKGFELLTDKDVLIHLGDICIGGDADWHKIIQRLPCKKYLVKGNHDSKSNLWYLNHGWDFVCDSFMMTRHSLKILFSHKPIVWDGEYDINIHGHFHNMNHRRKEKEMLVIKNPMQKLLSIEWNNYQLFNLDKILGEFRLPLVDKLGSQNVSKNL